MDLLNNWKENVLRHNSSFSEENITMAVKIFKSILPENYYHVESVDIAKAGNLKSNLSNQRWFTFLLCQFNSGSISHIIEISQVFYYFNTPAYKNYFRKLLYAKGEINKDFFNGNYFELYIAFIFLTNGLNVDVDISDPTIRANKPLDGFLKIDGEEYLVECKQLSTPEKYLKIIDGNYHIIQEYLRRRSIIIQSGYVPGSELDVCGYYVLDNQPDSILSEFSRKLKEHLNRVINDDIPEPKFDFANPSGLYIEKYVPGLFESYTLENADVALKFKLTSFVTESNIKLSDPAHEITERIRKKGISLKKKQHRESKINNKIIMIGINNAYNSVIPLNKEFFEKNRVRFLERLDDNVAVCFVVKNILADTPFDIFCYVISKDNSRLENKLASLDWYQGQLRFGNHPRK